MHNKFATLSKILRAQSLCWVTKLLCTEYLPFHSPSILPVVLLHLNHTKHTFAHINTQVCVCVCKTSKFMQMQKFHDNLD